MKYLSLFSGVGGFELGIQRAMSADCIGYSEIDKNAIKTYERNFHGQHPKLGDATKIKGPELPDFDLLVGGFPCQTFSVSGKRAGFSDTRGTLFFDISRILSDKRPRHFLLENVKGLLSHDGGKTVQTMVKLLTDLGYVVEWQLLNAKNFGVPQNRERLFIVGHLGAECSGQVFPIRGTTGKSLEQIIGGMQGNRVYDTSGVSSTIASQSGGLGPHTGLYKVVAQRGRGTPPKQTLEFRSDENTNTLTSVQKDNMVVNFSRKNGVGGEIDVAHTISSSDYRGLNRNQTQNAVVNNSRIRRLTPLECERLMGLPDNWVVGSDTQIYKQCGNAVVVNCVTAIIERMLKIKCISKD